MIEDIIKRFIIDLKKILNENILSVLLYGSVVLDDFYLGYSDIDFLVVTKDELNKIESKQLIYLFKKYRFNQMDLKILEGYVTSHQLLVGNKNKGIQIFWNGIREHISYHHSIDAYTMYQIKKTGKIIYGDNFVNQLDDVKEFQIITQIKKYLHHSKRHILITNDIHCIDWFFVFSSMIYYLINNEMKSKSHSALWVYQQIKLNFAKVMPKCIAIRQNPKLFKIPEYYNWVQTLAPELKQITEYLENLVNNYEE